MESSRPRDSTTRPRRFAGPLDWLIGASLALAVVVALAGVDVRIGAVSLRSHSAARVLVVSAALLAIRWRLGIGASATWFMRIALLAAICGSVTTWLRFLLTTIGGADSYGYVSASQLIAGGHLIDAAPIAEWLSAPNRLALASPLGWAPAPDGSGIAPTYPIGVPVVMALVSLIGGTNAVFLVSPAMAIATLLLVYRLARDWFDAETGLLAAALVAWNPVFITYAKQPMSDMAATLWIMLALVLSVRNGAISGFTAGLAAGVAVITRPALLVAAAIVPLAAHRGEQKMRRLMIAGAGLAIGVMATMAIQNHLFGSPFSTGYGTTGALFSISHLATNLGIFARQGWTVVGPLWIPGLVIGLIAARPEPRWKPAAILAGVALPYLFYLPFDHWETLRYLLPGIVPLTALVAAGLMHIARTPRTPAVTAVVIAAVVAIVAGRSESLLRASSVWDIASLEARYPLAGEWINVNTPPTSVVMANQHSGSLRWYGKRQTIRWDFIAPEQLVVTVRDLQSRGATVYVALEGDEVAMFDRRFVQVIDLLQVDHVGRVRNVNFRRLQ
jgi:Dolichyl-phosphate-mannose-protein mannosyltransferase